MEIRNSADINEDCELLPLLNEMHIGRFFKIKDYGNNDVKLWFVINCLSFEQKHNKGRFTKIDNVLYWDIILDYETIKKATVKEKKNTLASSIINSFDILDKYKKLNLNKEAIKEDAKKYFIQLGWLQPNYLSVAR